jgi:hypothetical protein
MQPESAASIDTVTNVSSSFFSVSFIVVLLGGWSQERMIAAVVDAIA